MLRPIRVLDREILRGGTVIASSSRTTVIDRDLAIVDLHLDLNGRPSQQPYSQADLLEEIEMVWHTADSRRMAAGRHERLSDEILSVAIAAFSVRRGLPDRPTLACAECRVGWPAS